MVTEIHNNNYSHTIYKPNKHEICSEATRILKGHWRKIDRKWVIWTIRNKKPFFGHIYPMTKW